MRFHTEQTNVIDHTFTPSSPFTGPHLKTLALLSSLLHFRHNKQKPSDHSSASSFAIDASVVVAVAAAMSLIIVTFVLAFAVGHRRSSCAQMNLQHSLRLSNKDLLSSRTDRSHQPLHRPTEDPTNRSNDLAIDLPPQLDREIELDSYSHPCVILYNTHFSLESKPKRERVRYSTHAARMLPVSVSPISSGARPVFDFVSNATSRITVTNM